MNTIYKKNLTLNHLQAENFDWQPWMSQHAVAFLVRWTTVCNQCYHNFGGILIAFFLLSGNMISVTAEFDVKGMVFFTNKPN